MAPKKNMRALDLRRDNFVSVHGLPLQRHLKRIKDGPPPGCPHSLIGSPESCSQCIGFMPKIVVRDEATGILTMDGKVVPRSAMLVPEARYAVKIAARKKRAAAQARARGEIELLDIDDDS